MIDAFTATHFERWEDIRDQVRVLMLSEYEREPAFYNNRGWGYLYDQIQHSINWSEAFN